MLPASLSCSLRPFPQPAAAILATWPLPTLSQSLIKALARSLEVSVTQLLETDIAHASLYYHAHDMQLARGWRAARHCRSKQCPVNALPGAAGRAGLIINQAQHRSTPDLGQAIPCALGLG